MNHQEAVEECICMLTLTMIGKEVSSFHRIKEESKEMFNEETAEGSRMDEKHAWDDNLCQEGACR